MKNIDIVIIGGGPAGISAGIYATRAGMQTVVIDDDNSMLNKAKVIMNYYGIEKISGKELKEKGINQYKSLGGNFENQTVVKIQKDYQTNLFTVKTTKDIYQCKSVILCVGSEKKKTIDGLEKYENYNVSYCAICDGFFYKDKTVAVIGDKEFAASECEELKNIAKTTYLLTNGGKLNKTIDGVNIIENKIVGFKGDLSLEEILFDNGENLKVDGVFVALGNLSTFEIAKQLGILTNNNSIIVDKNYMTNVAGVFAGGDVIGGLLQIAKAVSDGACAGLEAVRYIKIMEG